MKRFFVSALVLSSTVANAQSGGSVPGSADLIKYQVGALWNVNVAKVDATHMKFTNLAGGALGSSSKGYINIGGVAPAKEISAAKTLTVPAGSVWGGGYTGTPALYVYASYSATYGVELCVSDVSTLTTVGVVATGNTGFVVCGQTQGSTAPLRLLGSFVYTVATPAIGATFTRIASF